MSTKKVHPILFISLLIIMIGGCGGGVSSQTATGAPSGSGAGTATVYWNPVSTYTDTSLINNTGVPSGYKVHYGTASGQYSTTVNITIGLLTSPSSPRYTVSGLLRGTKYYFAISAYDSSNVESVLSSELSGTIR